MRLSNTSCEAEEVLKDKNRIGFLETVYDQRILFFPSGFPRLGGEKTMINYYVLSPCLPTALRIYSSPCLPELHVRPSQTGDNLLMSPQRPQHQTDSPPGYKEYYHHASVSSHQLEGLGPNTLSKSSLIQHFHNETTLHKFFTAQGIFP